MRTTKTMNRRWIVFWGSLFFALGLMGVVSTAHAQRIDEPYQGSRPITLDAPIGNFGFSDNSFAIGVRLGIPIVHNGFIPRLNNAVYINFGIDTYFYPFDNDPYISLGIPVTLHWEFYFNERWSAFAELGVNIHLGELFRGKKFILLPANWLFLAAGGKLHLSQSFALVLRVGNPYLSFGCSWSF